jgi:ferredoxin-NADP reductase
LVSVADWVPAEVASVSETTPTARVIRVRVPGWPGNLPGQHLDLRLTAEDGYQAVRSYSLASSGPDEVLELGVDEVADGEVSPYLVRDVLPGDALEVKGPLGGYFVWHDDDPAPVQLIAGGSGIVPLLAIARARAASSSTAPFRLLVSVRSPVDAMYRDEIERLPASGVEVAWVYTREAPAGWTGAVGRLDPAALARAAWPADTSPLVFVCGPTGFVEAVASALVALGHDPGRVRTERFGGM